MDTYSRSSWAIIVLQTSQTRNEEKDVEGKTEQRGCDAVVISPTCSDDARCVPKFPKSKGRGLAR
jgi:hypothetical protein